MKIKVTTQIGLKIQFVEVEEVEIWNGPKTMFHLQCSSTNQEDVSSSKERNEISCGEGKYGIVAPTRSRRVAIHKGLRANYK